MMVVSGLMSTSSENFPHIPVALAAILDHATWPQMVGPGRHVTGTLLQWSLVLELGGEVYKVPRVAVRGDPAGTGGKARS